MFANITAILRKELQGYLTSPFAYIIAAVFWLVIGFFFWAVLNNLLQDIAFQEQQGGVSIPRDMASELLRGFLGIVSSLLLVLLPALSMGLYAEERKRGTLELLGTSPVTNWTVALGKLLGVVGFFTILLVPAWLYQIFIFSETVPPIQPQVILLANGGIILLSAAVLSLGMFVSSLTESSILAYILTFILVLFLWISDVIANNVGGALGEVLSHLSLFQNYDNLMRGIVDTSSLFLFASYIFLGIFLTAQSIDILRHKS